MYLMAKRYGHIGQKAMRDAVAALEGEAANLDDGKKKPVESEKPDSFSSTDAKDKKKPA